MLSKIILNNDLYLLKKKLKQGYTLDRNWYVYDALKTFDVDMISFVLTHALEKHEHGEVYFFMIDSDDERDMDEKVECFKILLKFFNRPKQEFETLKELDRQIKEENEKRLDVLSLIAYKKGKGECINGDIREVIGEFL
jgi:hypothetical protein